MNLTESAVQEALDTLNKMHLAGEASGYGGRVAKYKHRFYSSEFGGTRFDEQQLGIVCVLMLRGPQTPGELRTRTNRLCKFDDVQQVEQVLQGLAEHELGPFVIKLNREPGKRESRWAHLFCGEVDESMLVSASVSGGAADNTLDSGDRERISDLEGIVSQLRRELDELKQQLQ